MTIVAYLIEPRFPGGTTSAVCEELKEVAKNTRHIKVFFYDSKMFAGREISPKITQVLEELSIVPEWCPAQISADFVIIHNPSFLKFEECVSFRIISKKIYVITHENFLLPTGRLSYDVISTLNAVNQSSTAIKKIIAPISGINRKTIESFFNNCRRDYLTWDILEADWFNIFQTKVHAPNPAPKDKRGRVSRPGYEKFPEMEIMAKTFPPSAKYNGILGADSFFESGEALPHWDCFKFGSLQVEDFLSKVDFFVYYTSKYWEESFGRVLVEAVQAGKLVITSSRYARNLDIGIIDAAPDDIESVVRFYIANPKKYEEVVCKTQMQSKKYSPSAFWKFFEEEVVG